MRKLTVPATYTDPKYEGRTFDRTVTIIGVDRNNEPHHFPDGEDCYATVYIARSDGDWDRVASFNQEDRETAYDFAKGNLGRMAGESEVLIIETETEELLPDIYDGDPELFTA